MFNIRLSSVLYPTQLHRHDTCARASARARAHTQLYRYYHLILHMLFLWWSAHVLRMILRGWSWRWSFLQVTKNPGAVVASLPRRQADSQLHHCTEDINLHHQHLTKKGICRQEVSRISNGCSLSWDRTYTRHVFPATGIGSRAHTQTHTHTWVELLGPTSRPAWHHGTMWAWVTGGLFVFLFKTESISCAPFVLDLRLKKKISLLNSVFTLCERFEGKRKAATQWVDYKLGLSFKQTEFINTEFPHTQLTGPSLLAYYCGSNADEACICTLMRSCVQTLALGLHLLRFMLLTRHGKSF